MQFILDSADEFSKNDVVATQRSAKTQGCNRPNLPTGNIRQSQFGNYAAGYTLRAQGGDNGGGSENLALTQVDNTRNLIRRLTPLE